MKINLCDLCIYEDFGYCELRDSKTEIKYKNDKESGDLIKCSKFSIDKERANRMFNLKIDERSGADE